MEILQNIGVWIPVGSLSLAQRRLVITRGPHGAREYAQPFFLVYSRVVPWLRVENTVRSDFALLPKYVFCSMACVDIQEYA